MHSRSARMEIAYSPRQQEILERFKIRQFAICDDQPERCCENERDAMKLKLLDHCGKKPNPNIIP